MNKDSYRHYFGISGNSFIERSRLFHASKKANAPKSQPEHSPQLLDLRRDIRTLPALVPCSIHTSLHSKISVDHIRWTPCCTCSTIFRESKGPSGGLCKPSSCFSVDFWLLRLSGLESHGHSLTLLHIHFGLLGFSSHHLISRRLFPDRGW